MSAVLPTLARGSSKSQLLQQDDQKRLAALEAKVHEQKKELENRDITIRAIQRNFEQLSTLCQSDKDQIQSLQKRLADAASRSATEEEKSLAARYPQLKDAFDALNTKFLEAENKLQKLQTQDRLDKEWKESSDSARRALVAQLDAQKKVADEAKSKLAEALASASSSESKRAGLEKEAKELRENLRAEQKARADAEKSDKAARADLARLQGQLMATVDRAQADQQARELRARLADAERKAAELAEAAGAASRGEREGRARLDKSAQAAEAYQRQVQELHRLLEAATARAGQLAEERDAARAEAAQRRAELAQGADVARVNLRAQAASTPPPPSSREPLLLLQRDACMALPIWGGGYSGTGPASARFSPPGQTPAARPAPHSGSAFGLRAAPRPCRPLLSALSSLISPLSSLPSPISPLSSLNPSLLSPIPCLLSSLRS